jgi:hypothetical protein
MNFIQCDLIYSSWYNTLYWLQISHRMEALNQLKENVEGQYRPP